MTDLAQRNRTNDLRDLIGAIQRGPVRYNVKADRWETTTALFPGQTFRSDTHEVVVLERAKAIEAEVRRIAGGPPEGADFERLLQAFSVRVSPEMTPATGQMYVGRCPRLGLEVQAKNHDHAVALLRLAIAHEVAEIMHRAKAGSDYA